MPRPLRSMSVPIVLSATAIALGVALLVGWVYVVVQNLTLTRQYAGNISLLIAGVLSFVVILTVLVLFSVFLAREIREVRRQWSFIDSVTHELRSPLASLRLCLETLQRSGLEPAQREELRAMMLTDVDRLSAFVEDILQASRIGYEEDLHAMREVSLHDLVTGCVAAVARRHRRDPKTLQIDVEEGLRLVTDPAALELILKNLIDNAIKYSDPGAPVEVRARWVPAGFVMLEVKDAGVGVHRRDLRHLFERFYRSSEPEVRARRGVGLGLFVVGALVRQLGGRIRADSAGPGQGCAMQLVLPRVLGERLPRGVWPRFAGGWT